jgi:hypothetical protein
MSNVNTAQRDNVVSSLTNMLRLLEPDNPSTVSSALTFQKTVAQWREDVQKLPSTVLGQFSHPPSSVYILLVGIRRGLTA